MASNTVPAAALSSLDIDTAIDDVKHLVALSQWIEGARAIIDTLSAVAQIDPSLRDALKKHDVRYGLGWDELESTGLHLLLNNVVDSVATLKGKRKEAAHA
jgi:hypothetical protein